MVGATSKKRILVTGASTGIGRACAVRFAELGHTVFAGVRKLSDGEALRKYSSGDLRPVLLDVTLSESIQGALAGVGDEPLAGLVNNAGIAVMGPLELVPMDAWRRQFEVNVLGLVAVTQAFLPLLRPNPGRIVNIGSIAGRSALPGSGAYDASKFAIEAITDALRMELQSCKISVSVIEPGSIATPIWEKNLSGVDDLSQRVMPENYALYATLMANARREAAAAARRAIPVSAVVKAVEHALTADRPKTRYLVGGDTRLWLLLNLLPDKWRDWLILSRLNG
jgi:NAD(P)-dependent dehydrogenase (short-subunit alcohol dehydrogenase family)